MLFVDANIFMYAIGGGHPYKIPSLKFFELVTQEKRELVINVEVLQEILYRFWAIKRMKEGFELFTYAQSLSTFILPITGEDVTWAKKMMEKITQLSPRDALHAATMKNNRIATIVSYDRGFDQIKEIKRIEP